VADVVAITREHERASAALLGEAFYEDPFARFMFPADAHRRARFARMIASLLAATRGRTRALRTADGGAAAVWLPPGGAHLRWSEIARMLPIVPGFRPGIVRTLLVLDHMDRLHPKEPHWYLMVVGSDPARRGQGHGRAVIQPVLDDCDRDGLPAYLESSSPDNVPYYARFGFEVTGEITRAGSPPLTPMWRDARRPRT